MEAVVLWDNVVVGVGVGLGVVVVVGATVVVVWPGIPSGSSVVMPRSIRMASRSLFDAKTITSKQVV